MVRAVKNCWLKKTKKNNIQIKCQGINETDTENNLIPIDLFQFTFHHCCKHREGEKSTDGLRRKKTHPKLCFNQKSF